MVDIDTRGHIVYKIRAKELSRKIGERMLELFDQGVSTDYQELLRAAILQAPPAVVFHTAPTALRALILKHGLLAFRPEEGTWGKNASQQPRGVYVCGHPDYKGIWSNNEVFDIWAIDATDLPWENDLLNPDDCWYIPQDIPRSRISLHWLGTL